MMQENISAFAETSDEQARQILLFLEERDVTPQMAGVSLMLAAGLLLGSAANDVAGLRQLATYLSNILTVRAERAFTEINAGTMMTRN
jgi:hypothetical protein